MNRCAAFLHGRLVVVFSAEVSKTPLSVHCPPQNRGALQSGTKFRACSTVSSRPSKNSAPAAGGGKAGGFPSLGGVRSGCPSYALCGSHTPSGPAATPFLDRIQVRGCDRPVLSGDERLTWDWYSGPYKSHTQAASTHVDDAVCCASDDTARTCAALTPAGPRLA